MRGLFARRRDAVPDPGYVVRRIGASEQELLTAELLVNERGLPFTPATPQFVWIATDPGGVILGAATAGPDVQPIDHRGDPALIRLPHGEFRELAVADGAERRGIGTALCRARMVDLGAWGCRSVSASPANAAAERILQRLGFERATIGPYTASVWLARLDTHG